MQMAWKGDEFLARINMSVRPHGKDMEVRYIPRTRKDGQATLFPEPAHPRLVFVQPVDLVIEGPCSDGQLLGIKLDPIYPMGECIKRADRMDQPADSWLHQVLALHPQAKKVLVFATCCGDYLRGYQEFLRGLFPHIEWTFPSAPDLSECFLVNETCTVDGTVALIRANQLRWE